MIWLGRNTTTATHQLRISVVICVVQCLIHTLTHSDMVLGVLHYLGSCFGPCHFMHSWWQLSKRWCANELPLFSRKTDAHRDGLSDPVSHQVSLSSSPSQNITLRWSFGNQRGTQGFCKVSHLARMSVRPTKAILPCLHAFPAQMKNESAS